MPKTESNELENVQAQLLTSALRENLKRSAQQRVEAHEAALQLVNALKVAGERARAKPF